MKPKHTEGQPHDRLTELAGVMTAALETEAEDVKAVVMLQDGDRGGICLHGYDDDSEAIADLFIHLKAIFEANGKTLMITGIGRG